MARVELDHDGIAELLRSDGFRDAVRQAAEEVAAEVRGRGLRTGDGTPLPVEVREEPATDRARVSVAIPHAAGVGMEARHGVLRRAAEAVGLDPLGLDDEGGG
ncbi:MAG: hypothetical protein HOY78_16035 [Saccharothrix sp.]|nr:hypothetical protein [Saccharothrix sp.]